MFRPKEEGRKEGREIQGPDLECYQIRCYQIRSLNQRRRILARWRKGEIMARRVVPEFVEQSYVDALGTHKPTSYYFSLPLRCTQEEARKASIVQPHHLVYTTSPSRRDVTLASLPPSFQSHPQLQPPVSGDVLHIGLPSSRLLLSLSLARSLCRSFVSSCN